MSTGQLPHWGLAEIFGGIIVVILTVEEIEREAQGQLEILERRFKLVEAHQAGLITEGELEDALLLLSLAAPTPGSSSDPSISLRASSEGGEGGKDGF